MSLRGYVEASRIFLLIAIISTFITCMVCRNILDKENAHPLAVDGGANVLDELEDQLNPLLFSTSENSKTHEKSNTGEETLQKSTDINKPAENIPDIEFFEYRHHATPHPTLENDELGFDYDYNDDQKRGISHADTMNQEGASRDDVGLERYTEESISSNNKGQKEDSNDSAWIPDCDIPPYPDMLRKSPDGNDIIDNLGTGASDVDSGSHSPDLMKNIIVENSTFKQELEDRLLEGFLDGSSGDMTSLNSEIDDLGGTETVKVEVDFLKRLLELKNSLRSLLRDDTPFEANLRNTMKEVSAVLEDRFGQVENLHKAMRVKDLNGRKQVQKLQDYHKKTMDSPDGDENVLLEVKKARKRLKMITRNNDEDLHPDYIDVMRELISMLKTFKKVVRNNKVEVRHDEKLLGSGDQDFPPKKSSEKDLEDQNIVKNIIDTLDLQLADGIEENGKTSRVKNLKIPKQSWTIDTSDPDYEENIEIGRKDLENKLKNHRSKRLKSWNDELELKVSEFDSLEEWKEEMTRKQERKRKKKEMKRKKRENKKYFGSKLFDDL
ncbi:uncharacterized protein LOC111060776 [Nilaparvata lugens]|uniref:uncharacterized protein LOC111060776 n=1 Tax=Nilaparvata lugens TaxID=108931 RepID=UPI00193DF993|nr:uncharacterized protein LOC111060776 [Nilaparvata lugens]